MSDLKTRYDLQDLQSQTIAYLRFPLIIGVVFIHAYYGDTTLLGQLSPVMNPGSACYYITQFFSQVLGRISVPLFFFISGFLFFFNNDLTLKNCTDKLKRRVHTLLIPYLIWGTLALLFFSAVVRIPFLSAMYPIQSKLMANFNGWDILSSFWMLNDGLPLSGQFWFIRDLMLAVLFAPIFKLLVVHFKVYSLAFFILLCAILSYFHIVGFGITTFFYFFAGAYFSINKYNVVLQFRKLFTVSCFLYPIFAFADLFTKSCSFNVYIDKIGILAGIIFFLNLASYLLENKNIHVIKFLSEATFFVFAAHEPLQTFIKGIAFQILKPTMEWQVIVLYFLIPAITILICLGMYNLLSKHLPRVMRVLTGRG